MPAQMTAQPSLRFCQCCNERQENDQLIKTQKCGHFVCFDCSLLKKGKCPLPSCVSALKSGPFKEFLPQDLAFLWEKASSADTIPNLNCSNSTRKPKVPRRKHNKATASKNDKRDHAIVWPPMVVVSYTEWIGATNGELMEIFSSYDGITKGKLCHHIEPYCGMGMLVFESSVLGYLEADRLHKRFVDRGTGRDVWTSQSFYFKSGRGKQLYGYLALKDDVDTFNNHIEGTEKLEYEMGSYQEMVVSQIKQIPIRNRQLVSLRKRVDEHKRQAKEYEESCLVLKEKLRLAKEESNIMRRKVTEQHKEHLEEIQFQEKFFKEKIRNILESSNGKCGDSKQAKEVGDEEIGVQFCNGLL